MGVENAPAAVRVRAYSVNNAWKETGAGSVTWNNQPGSTYRGDPATDVGTGSGILWPAGGG